MANEELLKKAVEAFDALSPEQKATMLEEQRQSWVRGNVGLSRDERGITTPTMPTNTRPAAPVKGLEMAWSTPREMLAAYGADDIREGTRGVLGNGIEEDGEEDYLEIPVHVFEKMLAELVTRSQSEAIIAAERERADAVHKADAKAFLSMNGRYEKAEADNAALTARVKELGTVNAKLCDDVIDYELKISERDVSLKALETQLAAALGGKSNG